MPQGSQVATFADIQAMIDAPRRLVSLVEYVERLHGLKQTRMISMLDFSIRVIEEIHPALHPDEDPPEILVSLGTNDSPEGAFNRIHISERYLDDCLGATFSPLRKIESFESELSWWTYEFVGKLGVLWAIAHEYAHLYRPHRVFDGSDGRQSIDIQLATERDADLWGISVAYLALWRRYSREANTELLRELTLYSVFWVLRPWRSRDEGNAEGHHLPIGTRLLDFAKKLAIMNTDPTVPPDTSAQLPVTLERFNRLYGCLVRCEEEYLRLHPGEESIKVDLVHDEKTEALSAVVRTWDRIRFFVDEPGKF